MLHLRKRPLLLAMAAGGLLLLACRSEDSTPKSLPTTPENAEPLFRALEDDLVQTCGGPNGTCHERGSFQQAPTWLGGPDRYVTIKKYRGVLPATKDVGDSILLTQIRHAGPMLADAPNNLFGRVSDWLTAEVPGPPLPSTGPITVHAGYNNVPLDTVASGMKDARLSFIANELNGTLTLSALRIKAPNNANVTLDSPFFVVLPRNGKVKPDPDANGFKGQLTVPSGTTADLFTGQMILLRWDPTGSLKIAFNAIASTPGDTVSVGCTALEEFKNSALPAMGMPVDVLPNDYTPPSADPLGQSSCLGCHAKEPAADKAPDPPVQAMDLRNAATDPATACAQAKNWVNLKNKAESVILLNPVGKGALIHPMKPVSADDPIVQGIKRWVDAEK
jgi:hypothetical protein